MKTLQKTEFIEIPQYLLEELIEKHLGVNIHEEGITEYFPHNGCYPVRNISSKTFVEEDIKEMLTNRYYKKDIGRLMDLLATKGIIKPGNYLIYC